MGFAKNKKKYLYSYIYIYIYIDGDIRYAQYHINIFSEWK